jgi:outer membrane immunogenic protein
MKFQSIVWALVAFCVIVWIEPSRAEPPLPRTGAVDWSGPYVGLGGGYAWGHSSQSDPGIPRPPAAPPPPELGDGSFAIRGGFVGGTAGANWQVMSWVFGIEGDYSWANIRGRSGACGTPPFHACGSELDSLGTLRGRVGYALGPTGIWLPYVTGGLAAARVHAWDALTPAARSAYRFGWTAGAGLEAALDRRWTAKVEYLYIDLGSSRLFDIVPGVPETVSFRTNLLRAGLSYRFPPADQVPIVTKY